MTVPETSSPSLPLYAPGVLVGGKYRLDRLLGEGGMGSVWAAHNVALDAAVAIKVIRTDIDRGDMALRLLQEARAAAKLGHPAIVRVFDVGQSEQGDPFIVMELLEGESLGARLHRDWRLSAVEAVKLLLPIADALRAAHAKGIVHRDIKPDNVFLVSDGASCQPKLVDFGIAKLEQREHVTHKTERGVIVGSPEYMSPEQARGQEDIDFRSDIWSFCVVVYQAICGEPPFVGANYHALLRSIVEDKPPSLVERAAGDAELASLLELGMAKDRALRWRSIDELGVALAGWLFRRGIFEDASGGSLDSRWLNRRSDSGSGRQSRASFPSLSGEIVVQSGMAVTQVPAHFAASAHAPTGVAPLSAAVKRARLLRRIAIAGAFAALLLSLLLFGRRTAPEATESRADAARVAAPASPPEVRPVAGAVISSPGGAPTAPAEVSSAKIQQSAQPGQRARDRSKIPRPSANPGTKPKLDLMTPY